MFVDIVIGLTTLWAFYTGYKRGIIKTVFTTIGTLIGLLFAFKATPFMAVLLGDILPFGSTLTPLLAFFITLIIAILTVRIVVKIIEGGLKTVHLNFLNRIAGGILLAGIGIFLLSSLFIFLDRASLLTSEMKQTSFLYEFLEPIPTQIYGLVNFIFPYIHEIWQDMLDLFDQVPSNDASSSTDSSGG